MGFNAAKLVHFSKCANFAQKVCRFGFRTPILGYKHLYMAHRFEYLIVGQGIAGTVLAYTLWKRGKRVALCDNPQGPSASKVAAGIFNPITGRKMVKTWLADALFPALFGFYRQAERDTKASFFHPTDIYRRRSRTIGC